MQRLYSVLVSALIIAAASACDDTEFEFDDPARGPGDMIGHSGKVSDGRFAGGSDELPDAPLEVTPPTDDTPPDCGAECVAFCESLTLENPVNRGLCQSTWGAGLMHRPIVRSQACRRLFVDMNGYFPTRQDLIATCDGKPWGEIVKTLINREDFVLVNQRAWADRFRYDTQAVSVERIYDMDKLVGKLFAGELSYDHFAAIASAHPVLTRRYDTSEDRAEAAFSLFLGRPPLGNERADLARLYNIWHNGYYDHPQLQMRLPDAHIRYPCVNDEGEVDPETRGDCTSVLWGYHELIIEPDIRARDEGGERTMWSGLIRAEEWEKLQLPGKLLSQERAFWEAIVDATLHQYLGYDLGTLVPAVREELVNYLLEYNGDIRALHFAIATSVAYLQSSEGLTPTDHRWTFGPQKQIDAEGWLDTIKHATDYTLSSCDHRLTRPQDFIEAGSIASLALLERSRWDFTSEGVDYGYADLARTLGGCPDNSVGGRFELVSILTTAQQLNFVSEVCDPALEGGGVAIARLLPKGVSPDAALTSDLAAEIFAHQIGLFYARLATDEELADARELSAQCSGCTAESFARPTCFAVLSSAEMMFY